ncbi:MAG: FAD:protein transferase [Frankiaceae bacterium]|nr:FAD:protein transferase [Frankiaceae bacterium]
MSTAPVREERQRVAARGLGLAVAHWRALGTSAQVVVTQPDALPAARAEVEQVLAAIDLAASRFRADSELSRLNTAAGAWVEISPLLCEALRVAVDAARWTDGKVDPTVGAALIRLGYDRTFRLVPAEGPAVHLVVQRAVGWQHVELDEAASRVRVPAETVLDLGATAKGLAADRAAAAAAAATGCGVLVNLGGDIAVAGASPEDGWPVAVSDVADPDIVDDDGPTQTIAIRAGGLATSSTSARRWQRGGSLLHHIIDPRSGLPTPPPWRTVSVAATTCVLANAASTAAVVAGDDATSWLARHDLAARLVRTDGTVVTLGGWPSAEEAS